MNRLCTLSHKRNVRNVRHLRMHHLILDDAMESKNDVCRWWFSQQRDLRFIWVGGLLIITYFCIAYCEIKSTIATMHLSRENRSSEIDKS